MKLFLHALPGLCMVAMVAACSPASETPITETSTTPISDPADTIYYNGDIIAMTGENNVYEAIAIDDGLVRAVGSIAEIQSLADDTTTRVDLDGAALLPGFIQAHAHFGMVARTNAMVNLKPPPNGPVSNMQEMLDALAARHAMMPNVPLVLGLGYDDTLMTEGRHPTRHDLDQISTEVPVIAIHVSGHLMVVNSKTLELSGIDANTPDPDGGIFQREADGVTPNGVLEETAMAAPYALFPQADTATNNMLLNMTGQQHAALGLTTVADHAVQSADLNTYAAYLETETSPVDIIAYPMMEMFTDNAPTPTQTYEQNFRIGGYKVIADGSLQGWTGYLVDPYTTQNGETPPEYRGYARYEQATLDAMVARAFANNWPLMVHTNGDASIDMYLDSVTAAKAAYPESNIRPVLIHAQTMREDQILRAAEMDMIASFFVDHVFYWGDRHRDVFLGEERGSQISPAASAIREGLRYTFHDDAPIVNPSPLHSVWAATNRLTRSGVVLGENQRISAYDALRGVTINVAYQFSEEDSKGSLEPGKRADLVILAENPLTVAPETIKDITVLETIKDGVTTFDGRGE